MKRQLPNATSGDYITRPFVTLQVKRLTLLTTRFLPWKRKNKHKSQVIEFKRKIDGIISKLEKVLEAVRESCNDRTSGGSFLGATGVIVSAGVSIIGMGVDGATSAAVAENY